MDRSLLACLLVGLFCTIGCDKKQDVANKLESMTERLCRCSSEDCARAVIAEVDELKYASENFQPSVDEMERLNKSMSRLFKCARKFPRLSESEVETLVEKAPPMCGGKPCLAVPNGIKGLAFGMSVKDAAATLGIAESSVAADSPRQIVPSARPDDPIERLLNPNYDPQIHAQPLPGTSAVVETTVGKRPAVCALDFDTSKRLAGIYCSIAWKVDYDLDERFFEGLRKQLAGKYGSPTSNLDETYQWRSETAVLECSRDHRSAQLNSFTSAHGKLVAKTITRADLAMKRAIEAVESAAEREAAAKEAELQDELRALDSDTSSAAENATQ